METLTVHQVGLAEWALPATGRMRVPGRLFAEEATIEELMREVREDAGWSALWQVAEVASLPGIIGASIGLPDIHPGYGFPIGGVGAFDAEDGVVVVGGVGFDINCGVRLLSTPLARADAEERLDAIGDGLFRDVPAGLGAEGRLKLDRQGIDRMLVDGAVDAVRRGYGTEEDLAFIEEEGRMGGADPSCVGDLAKKRQLRQVGTLGSGNHYLEVQWIERVYDEVAASAYGLEEGQIVVAVHTGSRALGHQVGQDALKEVGRAAKAGGIDVPSPELACAPIDSDAGSRYLAAMAGAMNCAFANRQVIAHLIRSSLSASCGIDPSVIRTVYDIGHNSAKFETHSVEGMERRLLVHRKGATRAFGPGRSESPGPYRLVGHPTFVGGTMGTASYILRGTTLGMEKTFGSGIHGAGRAMSRKKAAKRFWGEQVVMDLAEKGIRIWAHSQRGVAEEAPGAYKDIDQVVAAAEASGISTRVARLRPMGVIKG